MRRPPTLAEITRSLLAAVVTASVVGLAFLGDQGATGALVLGMGSVIGYVFRSKLVGPSDERGG